MKLSYLCIMTFWFSLTDSGKLHKKHVYNSVLPLPLEQIYNISSWVRHLHLQQCVLVEIGEKYCGVFVEFRSLKLQINTGIQEYFLGLCDTDTLRRWRFCPSALERERPEECIFQARTEFSNNPARVHRRLCEVTDLAFYADLCDCSGVLAGQQLHKVLVPNNTGFPTCFITPLPVSLCKPRNVCGIASCNASTLGRQIHVVQCNPKCLGGQPFCEATGLETSQASEIDSYWSDWHELSCNSQTQDCSTDFLYSEALCINRLTGMGAIDCLGPGTNCCPADIGKCKCYIYTEDGVLKLFRQIQLKTPTFGNTGPVQFYERNFYRRHRPTDRNIGEPLYNRDFLKSTRTIEKEFYDRNVFAPTSRNIDQLYERHFFRPTDRDIEKSFYDRNLFREDAPTDRNIEEPKLSRKRFLRRKRLEEEEYEDDDDSEDTNDGDIMLEEVEDDKTYDVSTKEFTEKNERKQNGPISGSEYALDEMAKDVASSEYPQASSSISCLLYCNLFRLIIVHDLFNRSYL